MRLGGPIYGTFDDPQAWARAVRAKGYRAAYAPVGPEASDDLAAGYVAAAKGADIVIAEVGAWSNPLSPDETVRAAAMKKCVSSLQLAERLGARCAVNISGSRGSCWDGPHPLNLTEETFDLIVETTRRIIDAVRPTRTVYCLETMPWMYPDSPESYRRLIEAIDRPAFGVHLDPANLLCSPQRYYGNGALIRECFRLLGPHIVSCHAKDILLHEKMTTHLDEVRIGLGGMDYRTFLCELDKLPPSTPLMLEHLPNEAEYDLAAAHVRGVARQEGLSL